MALRTRKGSVSPTIAFSNLLGAASSIKTLVEFSAELDNPLIPVDKLHSSTYAFLREQKTTMNDALATRGVSEVARAYFDDAAYDVLAQASPVMAKVDEILVWIETNYPLSSDGTLSYLFFDDTQANGLGIKTITSAEASPLKTLFTELLVLLD